MLVDLTVLLDRLATAYAAERWDECDRILGEWQGRKGRSFASVRMRLAVQQGRGDPEAPAAWTEHMQQLARLSTHQPGAENPELMMDLQTLEDWTSADIWDVFGKLIGARGQGAAETPFDGWIGLIGLELWLLRRPRDPAVLKALAGGYDGQGIRTLGIALDLLADALGGAPGEAGEAPGYPGWNELLAAEPPAGPGMRQQLSRWLGHPII